MADIAALNLSVRFDQVEGSTVALKEQTKASSAAERAAQKWGVSTKEAGRSSETFSRRVQGTIKSLEWERAQLVRSAAEQARYTALKRAGVTAASAEGAAITASVAALQAQRAAIARNTIVTTGLASASTSSAGGFAVMTRALGPLAAAVSVAAVAMSVWRAGMVAANLGEQAEQVGLTTDQLQAYRFAAAQAGIDTAQLDAAMMRLTKAMGTANDGNDEMIARFEKLGVKLLDVNGELRKPADVLPELSRGLLKVSSETERNALMMEFMGRSGGRMVTMLGEWARGNDAVVESARRQGGIIRAEAIANWDKLGDALSRAGSGLTVLFATMTSGSAHGAADLMDRLAKNTQAAAGALQALPKDAGFMAKLDAIFGGRTGNNTMGGLRLSTPAELAGDKLDADRGALDKLNAARQGASGSTAAMLDEKIRRQTEIVRQQEASSRALALAQQNEAARALLINDGLPARDNPKSGGVAQPTGDAARKAGAGAVDSYRKMIAGTEQYIALKNIETQALGMNAGAASRLKHEQELLGKVANDNMKLGPQQIEQLKAQAAAMAEADAAFKSATFMNDNKTKAEEFVANQQLEQQALFMSTQAADALRFSTEALTAAKRAGIELTPAQIESINQSAEAMAAAKASTAQYTQIISLGRDVFKGFFSDMREGLMNGQTLWESFGNSAVNALNRIAEKLIEMAATKMFEAAFGGASGGGSGLLGGLLGGGGGGTGGGILDGIFTSLMGSPFMAKGGAFQHGNVIPFARGGIVNRPTFFPMANGAGVMGEAGPEGILPLRRGRGGRLGVEASGGGGAAPVIRIEIAADSGWVRAVAKDESGRVVAQSAPQIIDAAVKQSGKQVVGIMENNHQQAGGEYR